MLLNNDGGDDHAHEGLSMLGIVNALRTGDVVVDMIIAMCAPVLLKALFHWLGRLDEVLNWEIWSRWFTKRSLEHERFITHTTTTDQWGNRSNADDDIHNSILLKAIKLYLHQVVKLDLMSAYLDLTGMQDGNYNGCYNNGDEDSDDADHSQKTLAGQLSRYTIVNRLPNDEWHEIGTFGGGNVRLRIEHSQSNESEGKDQSNNNNNNSSSRNVENTMFHFLSPEKGSIDCFIDTAYRWYLNELRKIEDNSRYYYEMKIPDTKFAKDNDGGGGGSDSITYKRYKLSDEKSFESLFFREKSSLLALVDHFSAKTGKYAIRGYPHKLGLLLYGPPGTGKTSLIKALAQYTGRSIVNVPLSRVNTNSQLMSVFFDRRYQVEGSYAPVKLDFRDVIYVMEDCDAASNVVKRRNGVMAAASIPAVERVVLSKPKSWWRLFLESQSTECKELVETLISMSKRLEQVAGEERPQILCTIARRLNEHRALGLVDETPSDDKIAQAYGDAIEAAGERKEQQSKLEEILVAHAVAIKSVLDAGAEVSEEFESQLLGEQATILRSSGPIIKTNMKQTVTPEISASSGADARTDTSMRANSSGVGVSSFFKPNPDALSLSGLLNVLDGVVDTPGRIVILTSNCPTMLDPALIRPGRVDKQLMLGHMEPGDVAAMLEHYFQTELTGKQLHRVLASVGNPSGAKLTPAQVEQMAAEHDDLEDMLNALEGKNGLCESTIGLVESDYHQQDEQGIRI